MPGNTTPFTLHGPHTFKGEKKNGFKKTTLRPFPSARFEPLPLLFYAGNYHH